MYENYMNLADGCNTFGLMEKDHANEKFKLVVMAKDLEKFNEVLNARLKSYYGDEKRKKKRLELLIFKTDSSKPAIDNVDLLKVSAVCVEIKIKGSNCCLKY